MLGQPYKLEIASSFKTFLHVSVTFWSNHSLFGIFNKNLNSSHGVRQWWMKSVTISVEWANGGTVLLGVLSHRMIEKYPFQKRKVRRILVSGQRTVFSTSYDRNDFLRKLLEIEFIWGLTDNLVCPFYYLVDLSWSALWVFVFWSSVNLKLISATTPVRFCDFSL